MKTSLAAACLLLSALGTALAIAQGEAPPPLIEQNDTLRISGHVHVILDDNRGLVPNVGIVIGERATLIVDTGLGLPNGEIVRTEAARLGSTGEIYIVSTHYHPEHDLGAAAFPADGSTMLRSRAQHAHYESDGMTVAAAFAARGPAIANLLEGATYRPADVLFDADYSLDLGGVTVQLVAAGPAHTPGDTLIYVEEDRVLFAGDIAQRRYPRMAGPGSGIAVWLAALAKAASFDVDVLVPAHGPLGDGSTVTTNIDFFSTIQARTAGLKAQGRSAAEITATLSSELPPRFTDWPDEGVARIGNYVDAALAESE